MTIHDALEIIRSAHAFLGTDGLWRKFGFTEPDILITEPDDRSWCDPFEPNGPPYTTRCWACLPATARPHSPAFHHRAVGNAAEPPVDLLPLRVSWAFANRPRDQEAATPDAPAPPPSPDPHEAKYVPLDAPIPEPEPEESAADRLLRLSREERLNSRPGPSSRPYFDREINEWFRKTKSGYHMLVTGDRDASPPETTYAVGCPACATKSLHSHDYHYHQLRRRAEDYETVEETPHWTHVRVHADPVNGGDDD